MNLEDLSPELMEKAKACKTPEEMLALAKEEGYELTDAELEGLAGGMDCGWFCITVNSCPDVIPTETVFE